MEHVVLNHFLHLKSSFVKVTSKLYLCENSGVESNCCAVSVAIYIGYVSREFNRRSSNTPPVGFDNSIYITCYYGCDRSVCVFDVMSKMSA